MNKYRELITKQQQEHDAAKFLSFAFNENQFCEMMRNWGLNPNKKADKKKIAYIGVGAYILKDNIPAYQTMQRKHQEERKRAIAEDTTGDGFIYDMFVYELSNHEFGYTETYEDTLDALGYTWEQVQADEKLKHGLEKATKMFFR